MVHEGLRDSTLFLTFLGMGIFLSIELRNIKRNGATWGSFNTKNCT